MKNILALALFALTLSPLAQADDIIKKEVMFKKGASSATMSGQVQGHQSIDYQVRAKAGQLLVVNFKPGIPSAYFNVLPPASEEAIFIGSTLGNSFKGKLPKDGVYTIRVYLMGAASKEQRKISFSLGVSITGSPKASTSFDKTAELHGIKFHVTSPNRDSGNTVTITPSHLETDNTAVTRDISGRVTGIDVGDINADGSPEIYAYVMSAKGVGSVVALSANKKKSLTDIYLPPLKDSPELAKGYTGKGEFMVVEGVLVHRFPIAKGKTRQVQYKLTQGEAGWVFKFDRKDEY